jgi:AcrR family transcriptional regulator
VGRKALYGREQIARAALELVSTRGPQAVTVADIANEIGAPTGSIYHRYSSREQLLAELWMDVVEGFQRELVEALAPAVDVDGAVHAAQLMTRWTREHMREARLLLLYRRQDFMGEAWPAELVARAKALEPQIGAALKGFARRVLGKWDANTLIRVRFALLDAPFGAIKPYVQKNGPLPPILDELIAKTVRAVLEDRGEERG